jgi:hypothetical protein
MHVGRSLFPPPPTLGRKTTPNKPHVRLGLLLDFMLAYRGKDAPRMQWEKSNISKTKIKPSVVHHHNIYAVFVSILTISVCSDLTALRQIFFSTSY